ncbi:MAG TPA: hypothetical protein VE970_05545 [Pseudolabrys sp.]|nr:hypothetical protein [Pseudolabrys sp.]
MSAAGPKSICGRLMIAAIFSPLFALQVYGADLNGAWANDPNVCSQIFVRKDDKISMTDHSELYGTGFIIEDDKFADKLATCRIKDRKIDGSTIRVTADCPMETGRFTEEFIFRIDDNDRVTRFPKGMRATGLAYFRCPAIK